MAGNLLLVLDTPHNSKKKRGCITFKEGTGVPRNFTVEQVAPTETLEQSSHNEVESYWLNYSAYCLLLKS